MKEAKDGEELTKLSKVAREGLERIMMKGPIQGKSQKEMIRREERRKKLSYELAMNWIIMMTEGEKKKNKLKS